VSDSLVRRGYLTTEWWTTVIGGALSAILAVVHINASSATHVVAVAAPALLAGLYAITRTMHKSALASALADVLPQAGDGTPASAPSGQQAQTQALDPAAVTAGAQTDPDFAFEGIPPIEDGNG